MFYAKYEFPSLEVVPSMMDIEYGILYRVWDIEYGVMFKDFEGSYRAVKEFDPRNRGYIYN